MNKNTGSGGDNGVSVKPDYIKRYQEQLFKDKHNLRMPAISKQDAMVLNVVEYH